MTSFDHKHRRIIVRAVYDGPGHAGKTTNLKQLVTAFTTQRRGELLSPGETAGRTVLFDWLHIDGGIVGGHALRCELLTVPGQSVLAKRRWHVLRTADVVVFVCDSTPKGVKEGRRWLELLRARASTDERPPPLIVQANKQDVEGALDLPEVAAALDLPADVPIVAARAAMGIGVRETVVLAIRAAANRAQKQVLASGIEHLPDAEDTPEKLVHALRALEVTRAPKWMRGATKAAPAAAPAAPPKAAAKTRRRGPEPPIPREDAPSGCIWPATSGREVLRALAGAMATNPVERSVEGDRHAHRSGGFRFETAASRRYGGVDDGRAGILQLARRKMRLGSLHVEGTALALVEDDEHQLWLWTVCPWLEPLDVEAQRAIDRGDRRTLAELLCAYTSALAHASDLAVREQLLLSVDLGHFAIQAGQVRYVSETFTTGDDLDAYARTWMETLARFTDDASAIAAAATTMRSAMENRPHLARAMRTHDQTFAAWSKHGKGKEHG